MRITTAWNMKAAIDASRVRLLDTIKRTQYLLDMLPAEERARDDPPYPLELAPGLQKANFLSLNYFPSTPFGGYVHRCHPPASMCFYQ
jgi:hypothetical protein